MCSPDLKKKGVLQELQVHPVHQEHQVQVEQVVHQELQVLKVHQELRVHQVQVENKDSQELQAHQVPQE